MVVNLAMSGMNYNTEMEDSHTVIWILGKKTTCL